MIDISVQNVIKAFEEGNNILDGVTFDVNAGERVGLLGKNGAGKTTLLKIITGEISADEGCVIIPDVRKPGFVSQIPVYPEHYTVDDVLQSAFAGLHALRSEMKQLEEKMSGGDISPATLGQYDKCAFDFERLGGYTMETDLARVINGLRIPAGQRQQPFRTLSGGERTRINLARLILEYTDVLLLDEPTNHLDMSAVIWLEEFLAKFKGTVIVVSHDRYFLDKTINRAIEINAGKAEFYSGNYSFYVMEKKQRFGQQLLRYERELAESKRLHAAADKVKQWGTGNSTLMKKSFAIRTRAEKALKTEKPDKDKEIRAKITGSGFSADEVLLIKGLSKSFGGRRLFEIDELLVKGGERIAIIGDNGTGKTTLVNMIMASRDGPRSSIPGGTFSNMKPDTGFARLGPSVRPAYLPQIISFANPGRTVLDTLVFELDLSPQAARNRLGAYLFQGEDVFKRVCDLSGGEKSRLRLCMLLNNDINLLMLDEPTNHLDLPSREWVEEALGDYDGTLIFISHDRYFINRFATRIWELKNGALSDFRGNYADFTAIAPTGVSAGVSAGKPAGKASSGQSQTHGQLQKTAPSGAAQLSGIMQKPKSKPSDVQKEIRRLEREIDALEKELKSITLAKEDHASDYEKLLELDGQEQEITGKLGNLLGRWEELTTQFRGPPKTLNE